MRLFNFELTELPPAGVKRPVRGYFGRRLTAVARYDAPVGNDCGTLGRFQMEDVEVFGGSDRGAPVRIGGGDRLTRA